MSMSFIRFVSLYSVPNFIQIDRELVRYLALFWGVGWGGGGRQPINLLWRSWSLGPVLTLSFLETGFPVCLVSTVPSCSPENRSEERLSFPSCSPENRDAHRALWSSRESRHRYTSSVLDQVTCGSLLWMKWVPDSPHYPWERGQLHSSVSGLLSTWH